MIKNDKGHQFHLTVDKKENQGFSQLPLSANFFNPQNVIFPT